MQVRVVEANRSSTLVRLADEAHAAMCLSQRELFAVIADIDRRELWRRDGAHDMAHWLWMRYGLSDWRARRWLTAAHALESLPVVDAAFRSGSLGVDKVVELCRFATPEDEEALVVWAKRVSAGAVRSRGDREIRRRLEEAHQIERARYLRWWHEDEGRTLCLEGRVPAAAGAVVVKALERVTAQLPAVPEGDERPGLDARRADALVAVCSARIARDADPDRATVVVHVPLEVLTARGANAGVRSEHVAGDEPGCVLEGGGVIHAETARQTRLHGADRDRDRGPPGPDRGPRANLAGAVRADGESASPPRRRVPVPGMREQAIHPRPSRPVVVGRWTHRPRQPGASVLIPPHAWCTSTGGDCAPGPGGEVDWYRPEGRRYRAGPAPPRRGRIRAGRIQAGRAQRGTRHWPGV